MAILNSNALSPDANVRQEQLFAVMDSLLDDLAEHGDRIASIAIAGGDYVTEDASRGYDGDAVARGLFRTVQGIAEDAAPLHKLREAICRLHADLTA
ncbi:hypothetical protein [Paraburkholderia sp. SG-MS1]|uniref:hypothetical protein n=1 Tax=Paraburkholderia sp. SG-MS1 TaxID=2023741 RepID=UPI001446829A|nr:hypothetical protein [Paraburkholderia sp. SG-MS1]